LQLFTLAPKLESKNQNSATRSLYFSSIFIPPMIRPLILLSQQHHLLLRRAFSSMSTPTPAQEISSSNTPMEDTIRQKIQSALSPTTLTIRNDSALHSHHAAMRGSTSKETHFFVSVTSSGFASKPQAARHRMVYALLKDEMAREGGIHALQLRTRTAEEEEREREREREMAEGN